MSYQPKVQTWASNARARPYSQEDFDQRDLRLIGKAWAKFEEMQAAAVGNAPAWMRDSKAIVNWICESAGITVKRYLELRELQTKWPDNVPAWASGQGHDEYVSGCEPA
jgi:hypothetical protein